MKGKKSFLMYCDQIGLFEQLPDEQAGKLIKLIFDYVNDKNPVVKDLLLKIAFQPIKLQLKRDLMTWSNIVERNRINGSKGGRPKKPKQPSGYSGNPKKPKEADNDNDNVTDIDNIYINKENLDELRNCFTMKEGVGRLTGESTDKVDAMLELFITEQIAKGDINRSLNDLRGHFTSWAKLNHSKLSKKSDRRSTAN